MNGGREFFFSFVADLCAHCTSECVLILIAGAVGRDGGDVCNFLCGTHLLQSFVAVFIAEIVLNGTQRTIAFAKNMNGRENKEEQKRNGLFHYANKMSHDFLCSNKLNLVEL